MVNIKAQSINPEIVTVALINDSVQLSSIKTGVTIVKVTADNAEDAFITVTVTVLKKIDVVKNAKTYVNKISSLEIRNASELTGLAAQSFNEEIATILIVNNQVEIFGVSKGTTTVIVTAFQAKDAVITVTVGELETIDLDYKEATIVVGNSTKIKINNFQTLENVKVTSANFEIADVALVGNFIVVKGFGKGHVNVTVSAFNAQDETISITVNDLMPIEVDKEKIEIFGNGSGQVKITNFFDLDDVDVNSDNDLIASAFIDPEGVITIYGNQTGTATIFINAKDAVQKTIGVTVKGLKTIDVDKTTEVYAQETTNLQIRNASELTTIEVKSSNEGIVTALVENNSTIVISGLTAGQAEITVSASNAQETIIFVTINDLQTIIVNREANVIIDNPNFLTIFNFNNLKNVSAKSADSKIAGVGLMQDSLVIIGHAEGTVEVTVSAFRAWDAIISVTVSPLKIIEVDKESMKIYENGNGEVKITNFSDLSDVNVKSNNALIATASVDSQGTITIQARKLGKTIISITAQDAFKKEINVEVTELDKIIVDREMVDLYGLQTELVNITNFSNLTNVDVKSNNNKVVEVINHKNGVVSIIRGVDANTGDKTTVEITADHAAKTIISVSIKVQAPLTEIIKTLALDSEKEDQVIDEVVKKNYGSTREDIKIKEGSFKAPNVEELKLGEVIIESNTLKYIGEIKLLLVPQMPTDPKTEELMLKIKNGKDLEERKPYWKEYFEYKGVLFFEDLMPKNSWNFKENEFEVDENGDKKLKLEVFELLSHYLDAVVQRFLWQDYDKYEVKQDYYNFDYVALKNYQTTVEENLVTIQFKGYYDFMLNDNSLLRIYFDNNIKGTISD